MFFYLPMLLAIWQKKENATSILTNKLVLDTIYF